MGRQPGWNGSHISRMEATIHKRRAERSITKMVPTANLRRAQRKPIHSQEAPAKSSVAEVQSRTDGSDRTGRTELTVQFRFWFLFGLGLSVLVHGSGK